jgi:hypothetical protein
VADLCEHGDDRFGSKITRNYCIWIVELLPVVEKKPYTVRLVTPKLRNFLDDCTITGLLDTILYVPDFIHFNMLASEINSSNNVIQFRFHGFLALTLHCEGKTHTQDFFCVKKVFA